MAKAKVFKSGNSQAASPPTEFRSTSEEVEIVRQGDETVLREKPLGLSRAFDLICSLSKDFLKGRNDTPPQERHEL